MKKIIQKKTKIKEGSMSNFESIAQFKEQVERYILKHKDNPNAVINDLASGLFFSFSEAFSKDGRPETNGLNMLEKMIGKIRVLMKTHENLIPEEEEEFEFSDEEIDDLEDNTFLDEEENDELENIDESRIINKNGRKYKPELVGKVLKEGQSNSSPFKGMNKSGIPKFTFKDWKKMKELNGKKFNDMFSKFFPNASQDLKSSSKEELINWSRALVED